ncbi:Hypothetical protein R9X50_00394800 [Acrodontium crateriforme]|uniref:UBX domain-containing protein n=1 Tax=Acrodontium crateriforme TaxID=150365 RepID=A0AAQ3M4I9_9PEZI|nr:Hypothetical protein R9X50_00394800 [Acrodontium crateriforme]
MASDLEQLCSMGFDRQKAELALNHSGNLPGAIDWLDKNADRSVEDIQQEAAAVVGDAQEAASGTQAMSMVCNDCGRKLRNMAAAQFHAEKTGHDDFAESTEQLAPLTEDEKKAKLEELRAKLADKRAAQAAEDKLANKRNEEIRKKHTKENDDAKEELQRRQQIKEAEKKRQEKADDIAAKKRIKEKIEADKEARRRKAEEEKAMRANPAAYNPGASTAPTAITTTKPVTANHSEARLRLQTTSGNIMKTFPADTTLFEVAQALQVETGGAQPTSFTMNFPKKTFDASDFGMTLREAGLVPSAALIVK